MPHAIADPIFASIAAHRAAVELVRVMERRADADYDEDAYNALVGAETDLLAELLAMTPATPAGCAAMLRHVEAYASRDGSRLFSSWYKPVSAPAATLLGRLAAVIEPAA